MFYVSTTTPQAQVGASPIYFFPTASSEVSSPVRLPFVNVQSANTTNTQSNANVSPVRSSPSQIQQPAAVSLGNQSQSQWMYSQTGSNGAFLTNVPLVLSTFSPNLCQTSQPVQVSQTNSLPLQEQLRNLLAQGTAAQLQQAATEKSTNALLEAFLEDLVATATTEPETNTALALALTLYGGAAISSAASGTKLREAQTKNQRVQAKAFDREAVKTILSECIKPCLEKGATNLLGGTAMEVSYGRRAVDRQLEIGHQGKRQKT